MNTPWTTVTTAHLAAMTDANPLLLDCRFSLADTGRGERDYRAGHAPGARYAHLDRDLSEASSDAGLGRHPLPGASRFASALGRWGWDGRQPVIAYDDGNGAIAARAWWLLRMAGQERVAVLEGGWKAWCQAGLPVSQTPPAAATEAPECTLDPSRVVYAAQLREELDAGRCVLVDARTAPRYRGQGETIDPVAGHVPGALNRPLAENLDEHCLFKSPATLRAEFTRLIGDRPPREVIHMCGSGVTACHNLLAMEHAGLPGSRLFAPSWSGWISDPTRPVAR